VPPFDTDRFVAIMRESFRGYVDEERGPINGFGGPRMRSVLQFEPTPQPWRELAAAYQVVCLADALELAAEGSGVTLLESVAEDPEIWCGTRAPGRPRPPKDDERLDQAVLGAALIFVAEGVGNEAVAGIAREVGQNMIGAEAVVS
jgi:hypothetical protein